MSTIFSKIPFRWTPAVMAATASYFTLLDIKQQPSNILKTTTSPSLQKTIPLAWGSSTYGELGIGQEATTVGSPVPLQWHENLGVDAIISSGTSYTAFCLSSGKLYSFGRGRDDTLGHGKSTGVNESVPRVIEKITEPIRDISVGEFLVLALTDNGEVYSFGKRALGRDVKQAPAFIPSKITFPINEKILQVSAGREHAGAVTENGDVYMWGIGSTRALGFGNKDDVILPKKLDMPEKIVQIACGREHTLLLGISGAVYSTGTDSYGQCGQGKSVPFILNPNKINGSLSGIKVIAIFTGEYHSLVLAEDGSVYTFGFNKEGQLGHGDRNDSSVPRLLECSELKNIKIIDAALGANHTLLLSTDGKIYAFGNGRNGQLGRGSELESSAAYRTRPVLVSFTQKNAKAVQIGAGKESSYAVILQ